MESYLAALDEYFCARYSDYVKLSALEGYEMPEVLYVAKDGNIVRRDPSVMRLTGQAKREELLARLKKNAGDVNFTFGYAFIPFSDKFKNPLRKGTFSKLLPAALHACGETAESAGEKLEIEPRFWKKIVKGSLYPEKNLILALALVCAMPIKIATELLASRGFFFDPENVRDVVVEYLLQNGVTNPAMRDRCLAEYNLTSLPIRRNPAEEKEEAHEDL